MKLHILSLSFITAGLLAGCNPQPTPPGAPMGQTSPASVPANVGPSEESLSVIVQMHTVNAQGVGDSAGRITVAETANGLVFTPALTGLKPGEHGFHVHQNPSCEPGMKDGEQQAAASAGGHLDPKDTGKHAGPDGDGHLGDLPMIRINEDGNQQAFTLSEMKLDDIKNHALVVHQQADDYSTSPSGNSGVPVACGVVR